MIAPRSVRLDAGDSDAARVARVDFCRFDSRNIQRTPQGGIRVDARLTRAGVFSYRVDGVVRREYRPAEEVFKADSLATLEDAPITDLHPSPNATPEGLVTPSTFSTLAKGHARQIRRDGNTTFVAGTLVIQDAQAARDVDSGARRDISCGYVCREDHTPGVTPDGERYDLVQRDIRYNHVALCVPGTGRAGREVAVRVDSLDAGTQVRTDEDDSPAPRATEKAMFKIKIDGVEYTFASQAEYEAVKGLLGKLTAETARADTAETRATAATKRADTAEAQRDADKAKLDAAIDPTKLNARVSARVAVVTAASKVLGGEAAAKFDSLSDHEIRVAVVKHTFPKLDLAGKSEDYVSARFDSVLEATPSALDVTRVALDMLGGPNPKPGADFAGYRFDDVDAPPAAAAPAKFVPQYLRPHGVTKSAG